MVACSWVSDAGVSIFGKIVSAGEEVFSVLFGFNYSIISFFYYFFTYA